MFYILYLSSLCKRRRWPDPHYEIYPLNNGFACSVRVNHRDYPSDELSGSRDLAREAAAKRAYLFCRNISVSETLYQGQGPATGGGIPTQQSVLQPSGVTMAMAQPRYVPPTGGIIQVPSGLPMTEQAQVPNGRVPNGQGVMSMGHSQMGL